MKTITTFITEIKDVIENGSGFIFLDTSGRTDLLTFINGMVSIMTLDEFLLKIDAMFTLSTNEKTLIKNELNERYAEYFVDTEYHQNLVDAGLAEGIHPEPEETEYIPTNFAPQKEKSISFRELFNKKSIPYVAAIVIVLVIIFAMVTPSNQ